jgi:hypothetical protein
LERTAQCHCGALKVITSGEPVQVYLCHCQSCQRRTGSVRATVSKLSDLGITKTQWPDGGPKVADVIEQGFFERGLEPAIGMKRQSRSALHQAHRAYLPALALLGAVVAELFGSGFQAYIV